ncbi:MAG TPA: carbon monoxide dehydrogenase subunit G [Vicinamibacterales bacterium]
MEISGTYSFNASPERVWALLMDSAVISSCIPGCHALEPDGDNRFRARLTVAMAAITGTYDGVVTLSDFVPGASYRLTAEGQGRPGFVKGSALIALRPDGAATIVDVSGTVQTGGTIARLGQRLIGSVSKLMMDRFFGCLQSKVETSNTRHRDTETPRN